MPTSSKGGKRSRGRTGAKWNNARKRVLRSSTICHLCGELIDSTLKYPDKMAGVVDHLVPVSKLAWDDPLLTDPDNLRPAHDLCNKRRGAGDYEKPKHPQSRDWCE